MPLLMCHTVTQFMRSSICDSMARLVSNREIVCHLSRDFKSVSEKKKNCGIDEVHRLCQVNDSNTVKPCARGLKILGAGQNQ